MALKFKGDKVVTQDLTVKPDPEIGNLIKGYLKSVTVEETVVPKVNETTGQESTWEYAGYKVPYLRFTFVQQKKKDDTRDRYLKYNESVFTFVNKEGSPVDMSTIEKLFETMNDRIVHIHQAFKDDVNYKELPDLEFNEKGDAKTRLESFKAFYTAVADAFNKGANDKPIYADANNNLLPVFIKVLPDYQSKKFYTLPSFVGKGFIERARGGKPMIELSATELANFELKVTGADAKGATGIAKGATDLSQEDIDPAVKAMLAAQ